MFEITQNLGLGGFASSTRESRRFGISLPLLFALGVYSLIIAHPRLVLADPDTYWHIAVGHWIIQHGTVPDHGIFSATMGSSGWLPQSWLAEILMALIYDHFGWSGLSVVTALCEAAAIAILLRVLLGVLAPAHAMFAVTVAFVMSFHHVLARPFILTIPILVVWVAALVQARSNNRAPSPWLALLIVLWANLHGGYMFGIGIAALLALEAVLLAPDWHARIRAAREWGMFGTLAVGAALITPFGINGVLFPFNLTNMNALAYIAEWQGVNFTKFQPIEIWLLTVLFAALSLGWRLPLTRLLMLLLLLTMALRHVRNGELLGLVAPLLIAPALADCLPKLSSVNTVDRLMTRLARPANTLGIIIAGAIFAAINAITLPGREILPLDAVFPTAAVSEVKAKHIEGPVFNAYQFGGYLIFAGFAPFIDGRAELYGDEFITRYVETVLMKKDQLPQLLDDNGITWTLFPPDAAIIILMDHLPGWRRLYADAVAVVHVRHGSTDFHQ
jgi:hypothetical protein